MFGSCIDGQSISIVARNLLSYFMVEVFYHQVVKALHCGILKSQAQLLLPRKIHL